MALLAGALGTIAVVAWISIVRVLDSRGPLRSHRPHAARGARAVELLAGRPLKALAYLGAAHDPERPSPGRDFLLASALRGLDDLEATVDCGADVQASAVSPDGALPGDRVRRRGPGLAPGRSPARADHRRRAADAFYWLTFGADGTLAFIGKDGRARVYDVERRALRHTLEHAAGVVLNRIDLSADGTRAVTSANDGKAIVWDLRTGERVRTISAGWLGFLGVYGQLTPDDPDAPDRDHGRRRSGWDDAPPARCSSSLDHGGQILGGSLSRDGALAATCGADRRVRIWDLAARTARLTLTGHGDVVWKCVFSRDGTRLLTTSSDGTAEVWDLASGTLVHLGGPGRHRVVGRAVARRPARIATANLAGSAQVQDAETGAAHQPRRRRLRRPLHRRRRPAGDGARRRQAADLAAARGAAARRLAGAARHDPARRQRDGARGGAARRAARAVGRGGPPAAGPHRPWRRPSPSPRARRAGGPGSTAARWCSTPPPARPWPELSLSGFGHCPSTAPAAGCWSTTPAGPPRVLDVASGAAVATLAGATDAVLADDGRRALAWSTVARRQSGRSTAVRRSRSRRLARA